MLHLESNSLSAPDSMNKDINTLLDFDNIFVDL